MGLKLWKIQSDWATLVFLSFQILVHQNKWHQLTTNTSELALFWCTVKVKGFILKSPYQSNMNPTKTEAKLTSLFWWWWNRWSFMTSRCKQCQKKPAVHKRVTYFNRKEIMSEMTPRAAHLPHPSVRMKINLAFP